MQKGGAFLVEEAGSSKTVTPEDLSLEQREFAKTIHDFVVNEVLTKEDMIEEQVPGLMPKLLREAATLGLLSAEAPVEYGGLGLGKADAAVIARGSILQGSFNVSYMAHTGIAMLPLIYCGTNRQKEKYLSKMASGEMFGAFALTEPEAGSDARHLINLSYNYAKVRRQFSASLLSFQMIEDKLAFMTAKTAILESLVFRACGEFDWLMCSGLSAGVNSLLREYAIEAAIAKVFGSETLFEVVDEALQIYGGYGYCKEYDIERFFRDARINRIYEGTNEINRLVISDTLLKLAANGRLDIFTAIGGAKERVSELLITPVGSATDKRIFAFIEIYRNHQKTLAFYRHWCHPKIRRRYPDRTVCFIRNG